MRGENLKWIVSGGGPLIFMDQCFLQSWAGDSDVWQGKEALDSLTYRVNMSDYDRACQVSDYLGVVNIGDGIGLVLGDEPMPTAWIAGISVEGGGVIVRGGSSIGEDWLHEIISGIPEESFDEGYSFAIISGRAVLFDSGCPGSDPDCLGTDCLLLIELEAGRYNVQTANYVNAQGIWLVVHRVSRA
jgi:hypothetical protein